MVAYPKVSDNVRSTLMADGGVLFDVRRGKLFELNALGARIWAEIQNQKRYDQIVASVIEAFPSHDPARIARDVDLFLNQLQSNGMVVESTAT